MAAVPSRSTVAALASIFIGATLALHLAGWMPADRIVEVAGLVLAAVLSSLLRIQAPASADRAIMAPSFVITISALMLFGPVVATVIAIAASLSAGFAGSRSRTALLTDAIAAIVATQASAFAWQSFGTVAGTSEWPWKALPLVAAVITYRLAQGLVSDVLVPAISYRTFDWSWPKRALAGCHTYLLGAAVATAVVEVLDRRLWDIAPLVGIALFCAHRIYADYVQRLAEDDRRREVLDYLEQGMSVLDREGRVTLWNDALERIMQCSSGRALGLLLTDAVPSLSRSELPKTIKDTLADGKARMLNHLRLPAGQDIRILQVKVLPVASGVALLWHDITERTRAEHELRKSGERLALAAEGANDGLWQWNLQTQEFYVSGRWRAMIGLPAQAAIGGASEWLDRVHADDVASLNAALEAHLAGATPVFQCDHRIRHEDGTYRRFLCRGVAVRGAGQKPARIAGSLTDTTEQAIAQERLRSVGFLDSLTGLCNRAVFVEGIGRRLDECRRRGVGAGFAVLYLVLDRF